MQLSHDRERYRRSLLKDAVIGSTEGLKQPGLQVLKHLPPGLLLGLCRFAIHQLTASSHTRIVRQANQPAHTKRC
jgi:hypothetical protein